MWLLGTQGRSGAEAAMGAAEAFIFAKDEGACWTIRELLGHEGLLGKEIDSYISSTSSII